MKRRLRILKYPWHTGHDYELCKLPHHFHFLQSTHRRWDADQRPIPDEITWVSSSRDVETDVMILHVDQWTWHEVDKRLLFQRHRDDYSGPKIIINHGCNLVDGCTPRQMAELVQDNFVVCNSSTAHRLWRLPRSTFVRHGMSIDEWPESHHGRANIVVTQPNSKLHSECRNGAAVLDYERSRGIKVDWIGRDFRFKSFDRYRTFLASSSVFFNPSFASANPRARTEAMLCGLAVVTTNKHGESDYIANGENGFASNNMKELFEALDFLRKEPKEALRIGMAGRETARELFHIDGFVARWNEVFEEVLGER